MNTGGGRSVCITGKGVASSKMVIVTELDIVAIPLLDIKARFVLVKIPEGGATSLKVRSNPTGSTEEVMRTVIVPEAAGSVTVTVTAEVGKNDPKTAPSLREDPPVQAGNMANAF